MVLQKNVTHKRMGTNVQHPRVMLVMGALEFKGTSLSSLDSLLQDVRMRAHVGTGARRVPVPEPHRWIAANRLTPFSLQEKLYLEKVVAGIASFKPKVLLVEKTVSRLAQACRVQQACQGPCLL